MMNTNEENTHIFNDNNNNTPTSKEDHSRIQYIDHTFRKRALKNLCEKIEAHKDEVTHIEIIKCGLTDEDIVSHLAPVIKKLPNLQVLAFRGNDIHVDGKEALREAIGERKVRCDILSRTQSNSSLKASRSTARTASAPATVTTHTQDDPSVNKVKTDDRRSKRATSFKEAQMPTHADASKQEGKRVTRNNTSIFERLFGKKKPVEVPAVGKPLSAENLMEGNEALKRLAESLVDGAVDKKKKNPRSEEVILRTRRRNGLVGQIAIAIAPCYEGLSGEEYETLREQIKEALSNTLTLKGKFGVVFKSILGQPAIYSTKGYYNSDVLEAANARGELLETFAPIRTVVIDAIEKGEKSTSLKPDAIQKGKMHKYIKHEQQGLAV